MNIIYDTFLLDHAGNCLQLRFFSQGSRMLEIKVCGQTLTNMTITEYFTE